VAFFTVMLSVIMPSVVMLSVVALITKTSWFIFKSTPEIGATTLSIKTFSKMTLIMTTISMILSITTVSKTKNEVQCTA
jgi:hypothetical protein